VKSKRKFRRKTLKQWAAFARRGMTRGTYTNDVHLHRYENEVILRKMRESGAITATMLAGMFPDLFNTRFLGRALKRMSKERLVRPDGRWGRQTIYRLEDRGDAKSEAA
jgi:hypothetical protein